MGWSRGSSLGEEVYDEVRKYIPAKDRRTVAQVLYDMFCNEDADDWDSDSNLCKDAGLAKEWKEQEYQDRDDI